MALYWKYVFSDFKLKLASLVLAIFIWLAIVTIAQVKQSIYVPIVATGLKKEMILVRMDPEGVFLTVKGAISEIKSLKKNDLMVILNLSPFSEGQHTYHIEKKNVILPKGMKVEEVYPDTVVFELDKIIKKRLKVVVKLSEELERKYKVKSFDPHYVEVEGAEKTLKDRTDIETLPFTLDRDFSFVEVTAKFNTERMVVKNISPQVVKINLARREKE